MTSKGNQAQEIYNSLRAKGIKGDRLITSILISGDNVSKKAKSDRNKQLFALAIDLFDMASDLARAQGYPELSKKANKMSEHSEKLHKHFDSWAL